jgi:integrase
MYDCTYRSALAPYIRGLLDEKHALGYAYDDEAKFLRRFDDYWIENNGNAQYISMDSLDGWCRQRPTEGKRSQSHRIAVVRQLALFMVGLGIASYIPRDRIRYPKPIVHVLTRHEITEVFKHIDGYIPEKPHPAIVRMAIGYRFLYRLILTTGLRNSEAASLRASHIDWSMGTATIYDSKGRKDRIIYLSDDMVAMGKDYLSYLRSSLGHEPYWLFPGVDPIAHVSSGTVTTRFREFWMQTSFAETCEKNPTVHALRHTFVVFRINGWMAQGLDLNVLMPYLSKFLGHKSPDETFYYYHQVLEAFRVIHEKDTVARNVIPEARVR